VVKLMDEQTQLQELVGRLSARYPSVPPATISEVVQQQHSRFTGAPIREFVPLFVERQAHTALTELSVPYGAEAAVLTSR
jgi:hypothetical protein